MKKRNERAALEWYAYSLGCIHFISRYGFPNSNCTLKLSFQQATCCLSFRWVNILHAWTVNSVNRLVKNPKHITEMTFPSKADIYPFASHAHSQECRTNFTNLHYECQTTCWWCGWVNVRLKWKSNCCNMCFEFLTNLSTELTVHACNQIADSLLKWQFPFYSRQV